ncbi:hypothetical protein BS50DRAFT_587618 [Corynespora cassiicola Philippines]|uniref:Secreted protein n=1 Tax=Corynespora cassiicola Philippines TaxID=1448308 RepID=A0A2T2NTN9_CORCC|nr:hypothetical protein BS50DRAFT_587618 [Corynespora cassiicola Philippines]
MLCPASVVVVVVGCFFVFGAADGRCDGGHDEDDATLLATRPRQDPVKGIRVWPTNSTQSRERECSGYCIRDQTTDVNGRRFGARTRPSPPPLPACLPACRPPTAASTTATANGGPVQLGFNPKRIPMNTGTGDPPSTCITDDAYRQTRRDHNSSTSPQDGGVETRRDARSGLWRGIEQAMYVSMDRYMYMYGSLYAAMHVRTERQTERARLPIPPSSSKPSNHPITHTPPYHAYLPTLPTYPPACLPACPRPPPAPAQISRATNLPTIRQGKRLVAETGIPRGSSDPPPLLARRLLACLPVARSPSSTAVA